MELTNDEAIFRILLSLLLGAIIGLEREFHQQAAGLRTHILVCLGATVFTIISISDLTIGMTMTHMMHGIQYTMNRDPGRIAAQIVSGIGFICGGAVLRHGASVRGLTTAASLWMMASIGMLAGTGHYRLSIMSTLTTFLVLFTIGNLERSYFQKHLKKYNRLRLQFSIESDHQQEIREWMDKRYSTEILQVKSTPEEGLDRMTLTYVVDVKGLSLNLSELSDKVNALPGVVSSAIKIYLEEGGS